MAITPLPPGQISAPNDLNTQTPGSVDAPNTLTTQAPGQVAAPNTIGAETPGQVAAPNTLTTQTPGQVGAPNTLTTEAAGQVAAPNTLTALTPGTISPTICPRVDMQFNANTFATGNNPRPLSEFTTYGRASTATYHGKEKDEFGNWTYPIKTAAIDEMRIDYDPETGENLGYLAEGGSTNLALYSESLQNPAWGKNTVSVSAATVTAPDGVSLAEKITPDAGTGLAFCNQNITMGASPHTLTIYAKAAGFTVVSVFLTKGGNFGAYFDLANGTATPTSNNQASMKSVGNGWYRCVTICDGATDINDEIRVGAGLGAILSDDYDGTSGVYIWGAQLEQKPFATSYIKTEGATVSRAADNLQLPVPYCLPADGVQEMTVKVEYDLLGTTGAAPQQAIFRSDENVHQLYYGGAEILSMHYGQDIATGLDVGRIESLNAIYTVGADAATLYQDGQQSAQITPLTPATGALASWGVGVSSGNTQHLNGHIKTFALYDKDLTLL